MNEDYIQSRQLSRVILVKFQSQNQGFNNTENYDLINLILILNKFSLYFYCIVCTISNFFLIISFILRERKEIHKYHQPFYCFWNQLSIIFFCLGNVQFYGQQNLVDYSIYNCKIVNFLMHVTSSSANWTLVYGIFVLKCYVRRTLLILDRNQRFLYFLPPIILAIIYSTDLIFLDLHNISSSKNQSEYITYCGLKNFNLILFRDLIDLFVFILLPLFFILYNICFLNTPDKIIPKLKVIVPCIYAFFCFPVCLIVFFRDYQIKFKINFSYLIELFFTFFIILNQSFNLAILLTHVILSEHSRFFFKSFVCLKCIKCKFVPIEARRNSPNDILSLKELQKLNLNNLK